MKKFCVSVREHVIKIIYFKKKEIKVIKKKTAEIISILQKFVTFVKKNLKINMLKIKIIMQVNIEVLHIAYVI